jgi:ADP-ribose pyrophosphatase YjhB (NUDIX family)
MSRHDPLSLRLAEAVDGLLRRHASVRLHRAAYRLGYLTLRPWWRLTRPHTHGVKAVVRCGERVLVVRHAYARRTQWDLPGGFVRSGEDATATIERELSEELGVTPVRTPRLIGSTASRIDGKQERLHAFAVDVADEAITPSAAELSAVQWADRHALPVGTSLYARRMIARAFWPQAAAQADAPL